MTKQFLDLLWCVAPQLDTERSWLSPNLRARILSKVPSIGRQPFVHTVGGSLLFAATHNQQRTLKPLLLDTKEVASISPSLLLTNNTKSKATVKLLIRLGTKVLEERGQGHVRVTWERVAYRTAAYLNYFRSVNLKQFENIVVATQHGPEVRALLLAAREQGVPTLYLPHAPVGNNPIYMDLPVTFAGLRGSAERHIYSRLPNINLQLIDVVGNPAVSILSDPNLGFDEAGPDILALSPMSEDLLMKVISKVLESSDRSITIAPHPGSRMSEIQRNLPAKWSVYRGTSTLQLIRSGVRSLLQASSGVAWEAAALGVPTATLSLAEIPNNYPFLDKGGLIPQLSTSQEIHSFLEDPRMHDSDSLRSWAREWCDLDGKEAIKKAHDLMRIATPGVLESRPAQIFDAWELHNGYAMQQSKIMEFL